MICVIDYLFVLQLQLVFGYMNIRQRHEDCSLFFRYCRMDLMDVVENFPAFQS